MLGKITFILFLLASTAAFGKQHRIDTLGASKAGMYVALEEYGYKASTHSYFVTIKIINTYTKEYVGSKVEVEEPAYQPVNLKKARAKAKALASGDLAKYKISG